ncbi:MAG: transposase family protein, partial [Anaerolineae bacterium]|nr:transposase family protein [Anaerolineae bacterium]
MLMRFKYLCQHPRVFRSVTGLTIAEFKELLGELWPFFEAHETKRLAHPGRVRAPGAGHPWGLDYRDGVLLTLVWLRLYPTGVVLGYFFGITESSVRRTLARFLPVLEAAGRATFRWP